ncbi:hypothetical protein [Halomonas sp. GD1P12]|uniref:hypothetical protein n=1 Tax=Halomonas sp. GD1P12 TaxID=2982691 RepID=UPI0021E4DF0F|nr:hypothetical protein [Halomonas sp. GD1P12]UYG00841.1 hypothetical protein OCT39_04550 [Halomonas sp. GD1P12]
MAFPERIERFEVAEDGPTFQILIEQAVPSLASEIQGKRVLLLPSHGSDDAFYAGSLDTLDYLNENGLDADLYSTDEEYKELSLHGADLWLGTFILQSIVIPVFCGVISSYIYDKLKAKPDDKISLKFIIEKKDKSSATVSYDGKVEDVEKALNAVKKFADD